MSGESTIRIDVKVNEDAIFYWALQYSMGVEIKVPDSLRARLAKAAKTLVGKYCPDEGENYMSLQEIYIPNQNTRRSPMVRVLDKPYAAVEIEKYDHQYLTDCESRS